MNMRHPPFSQHAPQPPNCTLPCRVTPSKPPAHPGPRTHLRGGVCVYHFGQVVLVDPSLHAHPASNLCGGAAREVGGGVAVRHSSEGQAGAGWGEQRGRPARRAQREAHGRKERLLKLALSESLSQSSCRCKPHPSARTDGLLGALGHADRVHHLLERHLQRTRRSAMANKQIGNSVSTAGARRACRAGRAPMARSAAAHPARTPAAQRHAGPPNLPAAPPSPPAWAAWTGRSCAGRAAPP